MARVYKIEDISGRRFGKLTVVRQDGRVPNGHAAWICSCECGGQIRVDRTWLQQKRRTTPRSCGCASPDWGFRNRNARCHPDRKHRARGLCKQCYERAQYLANAEKLSAKYHELKRTNPEKFLEKGRLERQRKLATDPVGTRAKNRDYSRAWRARDPQAAKIKARDHFRHWLAENAEYNRERVRAYAAANPEKASAWRRTNHAKRKASCVAHTALPATPQERAALVAPGQTCFYCNESPAEHVDHFIPIVRWATTELTDHQRAEGPDHVNNLVGACAACNLSKGSKIPGVEWTGRKKAA